MSIPNTTSISPWPNLGNATCCLSQVSLLHRGQYDESIRMNGNGIDTRHERPRRWDRHHHSHTIPPIVVTGLLALLGTNYVTRDVIDQRDPNVASWRCTFCCHAAPSCTVGWGRQSSTYYLGQCCCAAVATFDSNDRSLFIFLPPPVRCVDTPAKCMVQLSSGRSTTLYLLKDDERYPPTGISLSL